MFRKQKTLEDYYKKNGSKILMDIDREHQKKIEYFNKKIEHEEKDKKNKIIELEEIEDKLRKYLDEVNEDLLEKKWNYIM